MAEKTEKAQSFEKALARLEEIAAEMESGDLGLEKMVAAFEEGQKLVKLCSSKLYEVEKKIEMLVKKQDGERDFVVTVVENTVQGVNIAVDAE